jgi:hypothetical protein
MILVFHLIGGVDDYVIQVTHGEVVYIEPTPVVNVGLNCCQGICESEGYNSVFELAVPGSTCHFVLFAFFDSDETIGILVVQFSQKTKLCEVWASISEIIVKGIRFLIVTALREL